jgi:cytochrome c biogenesis protein CcdA
VDGCDLPAARRLENRGMTWMIGAFVFCPCHLPITLAVLGALLGGTAAGALLHAHPYAAGAVVSVVWAAGTWRGFSLVRSAHRFAYNSRRHGVSQSVSGHHGSEP